MRRDKARLAVYALGGVYLLYLAWELLQGLPTAGSEKPLMIVFIALFAVIGVAAIGAGVYSGWKQAKETAEAAKRQAEEPSEEEKEEEEQS